MKWAKKQYHSFDLISWMTLAEDKKLHLVFNIADFCQVLPSHYEKGGNVSSHERNVQRGPDAKVTTFP